MVTPQHPGEILRQQFMEPCGISNYDLTKSLHVAESTIANVVSGRSSLSESLAERLERAFGLGVAEWMDLQRNFDLVQKISA
ncbi:HigA family addiction module antitoxin [Corynebacterium callunae]|uniref:HigA family addiction module antitoxin n=1 Tax=Corynebacterium callunae TaxID=1721 RepID=UPI0039821A8F